MHGAIRVSSVFTSESGEWRLGGLDLLSSMKEDDAVIYVRLQTNGLVAPLDADAPDRPTLVFCPVSISMPRLKFQRLAGTRSKETLLQQQIRTTSGC